MIDSAALRQGNMEHWLLFFFNWWNRSPSLHQVVTNVNICVNIQLGMNVNNCAMLCGCDISPGVYAIVLNSFWNVGLGKLQRKVALHGGTLTQVLEVGVWHYAYLKPLAKSQHMNKITQRAPVASQVNFSFDATWHQQHFLLYKSRMEFPFYNKGFLHYLFLFGEHNIYYPVKNKKRVITLSFFSNKDIPRLPLSEICSL